MSRSAIIWGHKLGGHGPTHRRLVDLRHVWRPRYKECPTAPRSATSYEEEEEEEEAALSQI